MPVDDRRLIHICGMYKCGTSWLTHILAAHPEMLAWRDSILSARSMKPAAVGF